MSNFQKCPKCPKFHFFFMIFGHNCSCPIHATVSFLYTNLFCLNPPCLWPGNVYQPYVTMAAPIRAPKRQYIPLQQPNFAKPLSKWVKTSHAFLKLSYKTFVVSTNLVGVQVTYIDHLSPWGPPSEPPNNNTYPCNNQILLSLFLSGSCRKTCLIIIIMNLVVLGMQISSRRPPPVTNQ